MRQKGTCVIIPAYNEERCIGKTLLLLKKTKIPLSIFVVDDGSTDETARIARENGASVIQLPRNFGKSRAFFAGLRAALRTRPTAILTFDADMIRIPRDGVLKLIQLARKATKRKRILMVKSFVQEGRDSGGEEWSGIRAFSIAAAYHLERSKSKRAASGNALETFLEDFFPPIYHLIIDGNFAARTPFRKNSEATQYKEREKMWERVTRVKALADKDERRLLSFQRNTKMIQRWKRRNRLPQ